MSRNLFPVVLATVGLSSCATSQPSASSTPCYANDSSDWTAWINAMPGPSASPRLIVTGKVVTPTGGSKAAFDPRLQVIESSPAQVAATLEIKALGDIVTQAVTTQDVRGEWPVTGPVGSVTVRCQGETLAVISPVETAH